MDPFEIPAIIKVENLEKSFGNFKALRRINLRKFRQEVFWRSWGQTAQEKQRS